MENNCVREILAARLFYERAAHGRRSNGVAEGREDAGARAAAIRARMRRERVARLLKALAFRLSPPERDGKEREPRRNDPVGATRAPFR
jgi:hypothetical protein